MQQHATGIKYDVHLFLKVIELAEFDGIERDHAYAFFEKITYPLAVKRYQEQATVSDKETIKSSSSEPIIVQLVIRCIKDCKILIEEVCNNIFKTFFI